MRARGVDRTPGPGQNPMRLEVCYMKRLLNFPKPATPRCGTCGTLLAEAEGLVACPVCDRFTIVAPEPDEVGFRLLIALGLFRVNAMIGPPGVPPAELTVAARIKLSAMLSRYISEEE